jgi:carbonic anhydrase
MVGVPFTARKSSTFTGHIDLAEKVRQGARGACGSIASSFKVLSGVLSVGSIDEALDANERYAQNFRLADLPKPPARKLAVITCMDARLEIDKMLGLKTGDAHIIRNAGAIASQDALRSLLLSHYLMGTNEFMIIGHTDCGLLGLDGDELRTRIEGLAGRPASSPATFYAFSNLQQNVRRQIRKLRSHPWIPKSILIRGFVYDVAAGGLAEVKTGRSAIATE